MVWLKETKELREWSTYMPPRLVNATSCAALGSKHYGPGVGIIFPDHPPLIARAVIHLISERAVGYKKRGSQHANSLCGVKYAVAYMDV